MEPAATPHILVVDDDKLVRRSAVRALTGAGFRATEGRDALAALAALEVGDVDGILSDIHMPEMDGLQLLRAVRARDPDVPVILITGEPSVETAI